MSYKLDIGGDGWGSTNVDWSDINIKHFPWYLLELSLALEERNAAKYSKQTVTAKANNLYTGTFDVKIPSDTLSWKLMPLSGTTIVQSLSSVLQSSIPFGIPPKNLLASSNVSITPSDESNYFSDPNFRQIDYRDLFKSHNLSESADYTLFTATYLRTLKISYKITKSKKTQDLASGEITTSPDESSVLKEVTTPLSYYHERKAAYITLLQTASDPNISLDIKASSSNTSSKTISNDSLVSSLTYLDISVLGKVSSITHTVIKTSEYTFKSKASSQKATQVSELYNGDLYTDSIRLKGYSDYVKPKVLIKDTSIAYKLTTIVQDTEITSTVVIEVDTDTGVVTKTIDDITTNTVAPVTTIDIGVDSLTNSTLVLTGSSSSSPDTISNENSNIEFDMYTDHTFTQDVLDNITTYRAVTTHINRNITFKLKKSILDNTTFDSVTFSPGFKDLLDYTKYNLMYNKILVSNSTFIRDPLFFNGTVFDDHKMSIEKTDPPNPAENFTDIDNLNNIINARSDKEHLTFQETPTPLTPWQVVKSETNRIYRSDGSDKTTVTVKPFNTINRINRRVFGVIFNSTLYTQTGFFDARTHIILHKTPPTTFGDTELSDIITAFKLIYPDVLHAPYTILDLLNALNDHTYAYTGSEDSPIVVFDLYATIDKTKTNFITIKIQNKFEINTGRNNPRITPNTSSSTSFDNTNKMYTNPQNYSYVQGSDYYPARAFNVVKPTVNLNDGVFKETINTPSLSHVVATYNPFETVITSPHSIIYGGNNNTVNVYRNTIQNSTYISREYLNTGYAYYSSQPNSNYSINSIFEFVYSSDVPYSIVKDINSKPLYKDYYLYGPKLDTYYTNHTKAYQRVYHIRGQLVDAMQGYFAIYDNNLIKTRSENITVDLSGPLDFYKGYLSYSESYNWHVTFLSSTPDFYSDQYTNAETFLVSAGGVSKPIIQVDFGYTLPYDITIVLRDNRLPLHPALPRPVNHLHNPTFLSWYSNISYSSSLPPKLLYTNLDNVSDMQKLTFPIPIQSFDSTFSLFVNSNWYGPNAFHAPTDNMSQNIIRTYHMRVREERFQGSIHTFYLDFKNHFKYV